MPAGAALTGNNLAERLLPPDRHRLRAAVRGRLPRGPARAAAAQGVHGGQRVTARSRRRACTSAGLAYNNITLNGTRTSDRVLAPGFTRYSKTVEYTTDDVTGLVRTGENVLATRLGSGQYDNETTSNDWHWEDAEWRGTPRLRADLYVTFADGTEQRDPLRRHVEGQPGPDALRRLLPGRDVRRAHARSTGGTAPGFDASAWSGVRTVAAPDGHAARDDRGADQGRRQLAGRHAYVARCPACTSTTPASSARAGRRSRSTARPRARRSRCSTPRSSTPTAR